jgi:hypothetical protein
VTLSELIAEWTSYLHSAANIVLILAGLFGVGLVFRSLFRAFNDTKEGRSPVRHYVGAAIGGLITVLGVVVGIVSNLVV